MQTLLLFDTSLNNGPLGFLLGLAMIFAFGYVWRRLFNPDKEYIHPKTGAVYRIPGKFRDKGHQETEAFLFKLWLKEQDQKQ